jgi:hypothetical protein
MLFSSSDFTMYQPSLGVNREKSFAQHPPKPNGRNKIMGVHDRIPLIQQTPGNRSTVTFAGGAFRNSTLRPDHEGQASGRSSSSPKRDPRTADFIQAEPPRNGHPGRPTHRNGSEGDPGRQARTRTSGAAAEKTTRAGRVGHGQRASAGVHRPKGLDLLHPPLAPPRTTIYAWRLDHNLFLI